MRFSDRVFYRKLYFSFPMKEAPNRREVFAALLKGSKNILVDCGVSYNYPDMEMFVAEAGLKLSDIDVVLNTHCHADHTGGNYRLHKENPKLQFWAHPEGKPMIENPEAQFRVRPVPAYNFLMGGAVPVERTLADGEVLDLGYPVKVMHTTGHSSDSLSLYLPEEELIISGDAIPYFEDIPIYEELDELEESLRKMAALKPKHVISAFCGYWDMEKQGDLFALTFRYLETIQQAVERFGRENPTGALEEMGKYVIKTLGVNSQVIPLMLRSLKSHQARIK